jgi:hypothetical protein
MLHRPPDRRRRAANARQQRWRRRAEACRIVVAVEVDERVLELLMAPGPQGTGWLAERDAADRAAIGRALQRMLDEAAR